MENTQLKNRVLWFDGTNQIQPELVPELLLNGIDPNDLVVTHVNDDINLFNSLSDSPIQTNKLKNKELDFNWQIPEKYKNLNIQDELIEDLWVYINQFNIDKNLYELYAARLEAEIIEIKQRKMEMMIKTLMYIIDVFEKKSVVWGVGRGSSCASLVLLVLGLHKVDPIKYNINMNEFFHD